MFHFRHKTMAEILYCVSRTGILIKVSVSSTQLYIKFWLLGHEFMAISLKNCHFFLYNTKGIVTTTLNVFAGLVKNTEGLPILSQINLGDIITKRYKFPLK